MKEYPFQVVLRHPVLQREKRLPCRETTRYIIVLEAGHETKYRKEDGRKAGAYVSATWTLDVSSFIFAAAPAMSPKVPLY